MFITEELKIEMMSSIEPTTHVFHAWKEGDDIRTLDFDHSISNEEARKYTADAVKGKNISPVVHMLNGVIVDLTDYAVLD